MKLAHIAAIVLLASGSLPSLAQTRVIELAHEAMPSMISMPRAAGGELTILPCPSCKTMRLRVDDNTRYIVGKDEVSLEVMNRFLIQNPMKPVVVMQQKSEPVVTRVKVSSPGRAK
jgi:hypothetical protein